MAVPTQLSDLSATAASNSPAGGDTVGTTMDDFIRAHASIIARISAGTDAMATPALGAATGTSLVLSGLATVNGAFTSLGLDDNATAKALTLSGSGANSITIANSATNPTIGTSAGALNIAPGGSLGLSVSAVASAVNYLSVLPSILGDAFVSLSTQGSATNITMNLLGKGSGAVAIGSPVTFAAQTVGTTVGAAGGASALPATPLGYLTTAINGTACKIPYYTA